MIGGISPYASGYGCQAHAEVEEFNPVTTMWRPLSPMQLPRFGCAAVVTDDGRVFVLGGLTKNASFGTAATNAIEEATLPTSFP